MSTLHGQTAQRIINVINNFLELTEKALKMAKNRQKRQFSPAFKNCAKWLFGAIIRKNGTKEVFYLTNVCFYSTRVDRM